MSIRFTDGEVIPEDMLDLADTLYRQAALDVKTALEAIREGKFEAAKDGKLATRDLSVIAWEIIKGRMHVEKCRRQVAGIVGDGKTLDLDAARDEIGRRLALLRNARGD
jgi:hypothetical protein